VGQVCLWIAVDEAFAVGGRTRPWSTQPSCAREDYWRDRAPSVAKGRSRSQSRAVLSKEAAVTRRLPSGVETRRASPVPHARERPKAGTRFA
jgi:hypothetical protein